MIQSKDLNFAYPRQQALFSNLTVHLEAGSITGLLGKNGAGKTSLLKLLTGLLYPQSGELSVLNHNPRKREVTFLSDIFLVPEEFFFPPISINDYLKAYTPFYPKFDYELLHNTLKEFDINATNNLQRLSHGQKKKFLIAFALATRCRLLVLDEPTNGLDIPSKSLFRKILAGSLDENQLVIISTHQVKDVENLIDKIIILDNGKVIFQQSIVDISKKFCFISGTSNDIEGAIYSEAVPGGYRMIMPSNNAETEIDIELLFNAIIKGPKIE
ncbi:MAG TPA: ABC transporter ATP-binding protein [Bacteroidales bacterium]|nr:ABC transporter ATP-binding protein [Bacteroidales bacterium]